MALGPGLIAGWFGQHAVGGNLACNLDGASPRLLNPKSKFAAVRLQEGMRIVAKPRGNRQNEPSANEALGSDTSVFTG